MIDVPLVMHRSGAQHLPTGTTRQQFLALLTGTSIAADGAPTPFATTPAANAVAGGLRDALLAWSRFTDEQIEEANAAAGLGDASAADPETPLMQPLLREMEKTEPGRYADLRAAGLRPAMAAGACLAPLVSERDLLFSDPAAAVEPGDVALVAAKGCCLVECKVLLGAIERDGKRRAVFFQAAPAALWEVYVDDLLHVEKVARVRRPGHTLEALDGGKLIDAAPAMVR